MMELDRDDLTDLTEFDDELIGDATEL